MPAFGTHGLGPDNNYRYQRDALELCFMLRACSDEKVTTDPLVVNNILYDEDYHETKNLDDCKRFACGSNDI